MTTKAKLLALRGLGAVTLVFYPGVVLATIMAAGSQPGSNAGLVALIAYGLVVARSPIL